MWTLKLLCTAATADGAPPSWYAQLILPHPWLGICTHRSRGIESMVACFVVGSTRSKIIDCVFRRSGANLESSSEPRSSTLKGCVGAGTGLRSATEPGPTVVLLAAV